MAFTITKNPDGDVSLGSLNGEIVTLQPAAADYATGGYAFVDGVAVVNNATLSQNIDLYRLLAAIPIGDSSGYIPKYNPATKSYEFFYQNATTGPLIQVPAATDLSAFAFQILLIGL